MTPLVALATWTSPVLFVALAARVFRGDPDAPLLVLTALVAPLLALLRSAEPAAPDEPWSARLNVAVAVAAIGLVLAANLTVLGDAAALVGGRRWHAVVAVVPLAAAAPLLPALARWGAGLGVASVLLAALAVGAGVGAPPWTAWREVAARPALAFDERSAWVTEGRPLLAATTLRFTEPHRITAVSAGAYRVIEGDVAPEGGRAGRPPVVREWRLAAGDSLAVRPGDRLVLEAGARVRFEAGKRVPGTAISGAVWADPPGRASAGNVLRALGIVVTLVGGAAALVRPHRPPTPGLALVAPGLAIGFTLAATTWGVYAVHAAPDLELGGSRLVATLLTPAAVVGPPWGRALTFGVIGGHVLLLIATASALSARLRHLLGAAGDDQRPMSGLRALGWGGLALAAGTAALWPADGFTVLVVGLGLAASAGVAPQLARGSARARLAGALVGGAAFTGLLVSAGHLPGWAEPFGAFPALVAGPLAWLVAGRGRHQVAPVAGAPRR